MVATPHCFVIAEAGVNHNGSLSMALDLIDAAAEAGADAVKFQTFHADKIASSTAPKAEYQADRTGDGGQLEMLRALELSDADHRALIERCSQRGIEFMSTAFDEEAADFLATQGIRRIKVPSGELTNKPFIEHLARFGLPMIVSTGMATLDEVQAALTWIDDDASEHGAPCPELTVLHCTSSYPAQPGDVNLRAMTTLAKATDRPVGYSDHTLGIAVSTAAVALGATVIEKHFTLDRDLPGPDHAASLTVSELKALIDAIRTIEASLGDGIKAPRPDELAVRDVARRSVTLARDLHEGAVLTAEDLTMLRPGTGIAPAKLDNVLGRRLRRTLPKGTQISWDDLA